MNRRIKKKYQKEKMFYYKGQRIWFNHAYCRGHLPRTNNVYFGPRVMLLYNHTGNEIYFDWPQQARQYIDSCGPEYFNKEQNDIAFWNS